MKIAVVGATGMVGQVMLELIAARNFPATEVLAVASERSVGKKISYKNGTLTVGSLADALAQKPRLALFSAGGETAKTWAPRFAEAGCMVIDNSSAWRMDPQIKLVVPEINGNSLSTADKIIANPNCSTIQLAMVLNPLHKKYGLKRAVVSTYQSITGTGMAALQQMENERAGLESAMAYPYKIDKNCLPHCDVFLENGYTKEEMKLTQETKKILADDAVLVTATAVRVPVVGGHSESVNLEFANEFHTTEVRKLLADTPGVIVQDNPTVNQYPMPLYAQGRDEVFVGRIRRDLSQINSLNLWIVADNLRKGAATNALQIAEKLLEKGVLK
jgi:aspartate-semialdehyde dehydrogenase